MVNQEQQRWENPRRLIRCKGRESCFEDQRHQGGSRHVGVWKPVGRSLRKQHQGQEIHAEPRTSGILLGQLGVCVHVWSPEPGLTVKSVQRRGFTASDLTAC